MELIQTSRPFKQECSEKNVFDGLEFLVNISSFLFKLQLIEWDSVI